MDGWVSEKKSVEVTDIIQGTDSFKNNAGTSLVVQWLRLRAPSAGSPGLILDQGTRARVLQLRCSTAK